MPSVGPVPYLPPSSVFTPGVGTIFSYQELDMMRTYMLMPKLFATPGAMLEGVFSSINGLITDPLDMGYTQFAIRQLLYSLNQLEFQIVYLENAPILSTVEVMGKVITDPIGALFTYRYIDGPALINQLSSRLAFPPAGNYFAPAEINAGNSMAGYRNKYRRPKMF